MFLLNITGDKMIKCLIATLAVLWTFPANANQPVIWNSYEVNESQPEFMPFDFTAQCLPLEDMVKYLSNVHGQIPAFNSLQSFTVINDKPMQGPMVLAINPITGDWSYIFIGQGQIACMLATGRNMQLNGEMFQRR